MTARIAILLIFALFAASLVGDVDARAFGIGHLGLGLGKLGAAGSKGSNGTAPTGCGNGTINLSTGCAQPMLGGL